MDQNGELDRGAGNVPMGQVRIALVQSCWHREIVDRCRDAFLAEMSDRGVPGTSIGLHEVPGAFEIPLQAKLLAQSGTRDIIAALGFVVDGGIYRHEFVAGTVINALMSVQLDTLVPVISAVLTPHQFNEHEVHAAFYCSHMELKGREAAAACIATWDTSRG